MKIVMDEESGPKDNRKMSWLPFLRQAYICSGETILHFCFGLYFGAPTVFIPQIRKEANKTEAISLEMESWLCIFYNNILLMYTLDNYITNNGLLLWQTSSINSFMDFGID
ncbi:unnamed protein product [Leptidea sinapis]|uniref:Uncharacterized protein n=1 Tax=Leptidea sinapis TaxID=189913 RepID=A0A5E4Q0X5_9NEOP|nr:unnamed protein product [Leptidea sinapis]